MTATTGVVLLLALIALTLAALAVFLGWAWWNLTCGPRGAWIAEAHGATVERDEKAEQYASDMYGTLTEVERLLTRIADAADESAAATRAETPPRWRPAAEEPR